MRTKFLSVFIMILCSLQMALGQHVVYADINPNDVLQMNFEILGKAANNYLVYKERNDKHRISVYDANMHLLEEVPVTILPNRKSLLDVAFFAGPRQYYLLFQHQEGDVVYLKAATIHPNGRILDEPIILDTTMIAYKTDNKIYSTVASNDNSKLMVFKINKRDRKLYKVSTKLFDENLQPISEGQFSLPMEYKGDYISGHSIANDGSYAFVKYNRHNDGNIVDASLIVKPAGADTYKEYPLNIGNLFLDDIKLMVDDMNGRYLLASFFSTHKRGDIEGLYVAALDQKDGSVAFEKTTLFSDDLKKRAKGRSNTKNAFNDFFINNIIVHKDGSFTIGSERLYNTNNWDRWGFWGAPYWGPGPWGFWGPTWGWGWSRWSFWWPYSFYSPFFYRSYWWGYWGPAWGGRNVEFNAGNVALVSFDKNGDKTWDEVIVKSQSESNTDATISYQIVPSGDNMHFLINNSGKLSVLENIIISNDGSLTKDGGIQAKEKRMNFMPRYAKQIESNEVIIPYALKNNIGFAKLSL
jgi:hypothetical protein